MIKTIALAAIGTFIAAAPALAGPGLVLQGRSLDGVKYQVTADTLALHAAPQRAPLPTMPASATAIDAELVAAPVQLACNGGCGGIKFNGVQFNGLKWNGLKWNGLTWNGWSLNGRFLNGKFLNGKFLNGTDLGDDGFAVTAVTLPGGERLTIAN